MEEMTAQNMSDNQGDNSLLNNIGNTTAPSVAELDSGTLASTTTVNDVVSKTFSMEDLLSQMDESIRGEKTWSKFKKPEDLAKSYIELQKMVGKKGDIPSEDASQDLWNSFYLKLGKPQDATGYDFSLPDALKSVNGVDEKINKIKEFALEANLTVNQAKTLFGKVFDMEAQEVSEAQNMFNEQIKQGQQKLQEAWGSGIEQMCEEVRNLETRLGVYEAFEEAGLNNNPDLLIALGKLAADLRESSTIDIAVASTPQGIESQIQELNSKAAEYIKAGKKVPAHIQSQLQEAFRRMG